MPEGPSIVILKELAAPFKGKEVTAVTGNARVDKERALGESVVDFKSWGKQFLICFPELTLKIHLLLFGLLCVTTFWRFLREFSPLEPIDPLGAVHSASPTHGFGVNCSQSRRSAHRDAQGCASWPRPIWPLAMTI